MKTIRVKNQAELLQKYDDGKIYNIADHSGNPMFDVLKEDYIRLIENNTINPDTNAFKLPQSGVAMKLYKQQYALEIIFTDDVNIEEMAKKALINAIKEYCYKVGKINDNNDDICLHYIDIKKDGDFWLVPAKHIGNNTGNKNNENPLLPNDLTHLKITKVGYDKNGEYNKFSGVLVWLEMIIDNQPNNLMEVFVAEECSFWILTEIVDALSKQPK